MCGCSGRAGRCQWLPGPRHRPDSGRKSVPAISWPQHLAETAHGQCRWHAAHGVEELAAGFFRIKWFPVEFISLISNAGRVGAVTLGDCTLHLIFIVSWNGNCFLPVNKAAGSLLYNRCGQTVTVCYSCLTAGQSY